MLATLPLDMQQAILSFVELFKDVCSVALVSTDMRISSNGRKRWMVERQQLTVQCGGCRLNYRAPGLTLVRAKHSQTRTGYEWFCQGCTAPNELSQKYHKVVERRGFHVPNRDRPILWAGEPYDFVMTSASFC
jgi:hypothetical protein